MSSVQGTKILHGAWCMVQTKEEINNNNGILNFKSKHPTAGQPESLPGQNTPSCKERLKPQTVSSYSTNCFPGGTEEPTCQSRRHKRCWFDPWVRKISWDRKLQLTLVSCLKNPWTEEPGRLQSMGSYSTN